MGDLPQSLEAGERPLVEVKGRITTLQNEIAERRQGLRHMSREEGKAYRVWHEQTSSEFRGLLNEAAVLKTWLKAETSRVNQEKKARGAWRQTGTGEILRALSRHVALLQTVAAAASDLLDVLPVEVELTCEAEVDALAAALDALSETQARTDGQTAE